MPPNPPPPDDSRKISRRRFARDAALAGAAAALLPSSALALPQQPAPAPAQLPPSAAADFAKLPPASQAEVEAKYQVVLKRYGRSFTAAQKTEVRRQLIGAQKALDALRAFPLDNSDAPATVFRPYRRPAQAPGKPAAGAGKR
ncbi:MAG TPA: twin-arginine translocation signal domain-containing protein [Terriglobales bacterium]|nr:twin-arginine translocation signal domain-containing protein [Terriglobales bacterium]